MPHTVDQLCALCLVSFSPLSCHMSRLILFVVLLHPPMLKVCTGNGHALIQDIRHPIRAYGQVLGAQVRWK